MKLLVVTHKETWLSADGDYTVGGFPQQIESLSELFGETVLVCCRRRGATPTGSARLRGRNLVVRPLVEPHGLGWRRKLALLPWLARNGSGIWREVRAADAVHALVPGDVGLLGLLVALVQRKRLFVRHCGTWDNRATLADRFLAWLLPRVAGGRTVVMATGGGSDRPSLRNESIDWIFSTTLGEEEISRLGTAERWEASEELRLVTVARLTRDKNTRAVLEAIPRIAKELGAVVLDVVGEGPERGALEKLARDMGLNGVTLHGHLEHARVLDILAAAHLFVFPTRLAEGCPKAVLEAMASGLAVAVTPVSILGSFVEQGVAWPIDDPSGEGVAAAALALCADRDRMGEMARRGRAVASGMTLESWRDQIRRRLQAAWGVDALGGRGSCVPAS